MKLAIAYAVAALLALSIAMAAGLDNPYWAGVAVWVTVSQPTQGLLLYRVLYRVIGTSIGSAVGLLIVYTLHQPLWVVVVLTAWLTFCTAIGNLFRQFRAYVWFLSGYTAAIVVLPSYFDTTHLHHFAEARVLCNFIGVFCVIAVMLALRPASQDTAVKQIEVAAAQVMAWVAAVLRDEPAGHDPAIPRRLLIELASAEDLADAAATPSLRGYRVVRQIRHLAVGLVALIAATRAVQQQGASASDADRAAARRLAARLDADAAGKDRKQADDAGAHLDIPPAMAMLSAAADSVIADLQRLSAIERLPPSDRELVYHRDWHVVRLSAFRTCITVLAVGLAWVVSGWSNGAMALIGTSIFVSVFSNLDGARQAVETVMKGSVVGWLAAIAASLLVVPLARSEAQLLLFVAPFIVVGAIGFAHPVTSRPAMDFNAIFLMALQLSWPPVGDVWHTISSGIALLGGMSVPWLAYYLMPLKPAQRLDALTLQIVQDIDRFRQSHADVSLQRLRMRLYHSVMRLALRLSTRPDDPLLDSALAALGAAETATTNGATGKPAAAAAGHAGVGTPKAMLDAAVARLVPSVSAKSRD